MKPLIIYAHPDTKGHSAEILKQTKERLKDYDLIDLYKINYNPILQKNELYTAGNKTISKQNKEFQKKIKKADHLVFIYPVWWERGPAILEGFFDRVFTPGFAYTYKNDRPVKLLNGKKATVIITSGAPNVISWITGNLARRVIRTTLKFCGIKPTIYQIGACWKLNPKKKEQIRSIVNRAFF